MERGSTVASTRKGYFCCLLAGVAWGFAGSCGQFLFERCGWDVDFLIPARILSAGLLLLLAASFLEDRHALLQVFRDKRDLIDLLIFGIVGIGLCQYSYYTTIRASNATTATVLCYLGPVLIILWVALRARQLPGGREVVAVAAAVLGTFLLATHGDPTSLTLSREALIWGIISAFATALYSVQPKRLTAKCGTLTCTGWGMIAAGIFLCLLRRPWQHVTGIFDAAALAAFGTVVLIGSVLCFGLYFTGLAIVGPTKASVLSATEPLVSTLLSVFWLHVVFLPMDYLGFALIVSTIFLLALPGKTRSAPETEQAGVAQPQPRS